MSTSPLISTFPLKSILKKENHLIKDVQNSKTEIKTNKSFQKKLRNSFKRLSFKRTSHKESASLDLKPAINIEKKPQKKVTFKLDKMKPVLPKEKFQMKEGDYLKIPPVASALIKAPALTEAPALTKAPALIVKSILTLEMLEQKIQLLGKGQERHFKGNHSYYQYMRSPEEEYQKIWEIS